MPKLTAAEFQEKHAKRLKAAVPEIKAGVDRVTEAPSAAAVAKEEKMKAKLLASIEDGTWRKRLGEYSLGDWKKDMKEKGAGRIASGIDASKDKVTKFAGALLPHVQSGEDKVKGMPDLTLDDSANRMVEFMKHMAELKYKKR